jgi:PAS domain-containing protein
MEKSQIDEISDLLLSYSAGHYHVKGEVSENFDEIDMIISGINMLGEELRSTNVSKEYFSSIFNAVTDLVMVADENGILLDLNESVGNVLGYSQEELLGNSIFKILNPQNQEIFSILKEELAKNIKNYILKES